MEKNIRVGVHTSTARSLVNAIDTAVRLNCDSVQIFSRNPRGWITRPYTKADVKEFIKAREEAGIYPLVIHSIYLINLAAPDPFILRRSIRAFREEIDRALLLKADYLVVHPGSVKTGSPGAGIIRCIKAIKKATQRLSLKSLRILIENTAGQGGQIGRTFEQVEQILKGLDGLPVGLCLDTAHTYAAGYDISTEKGLQAIASAITSTVGEENIHLIHANDTRIPLGGALDRHWHIGQGNIGRAGFGRIVNHPFLRRCPFILETPKKSFEDDLRNMALLRELAGAQQGTEARNRSS